MRLHQCDAHLEWTRFHLAAGEGVDAHRHLEVARGLVEETGYRRREGEVAFLGERVVLLGGVISVSGSKESPSGGFP